MKQDSRDIELGIHDSCALEDIVECRQAHLRFGGACVDEFKSDGEIAHQKIEFNAYRHSTATPRAAW